MSSNTMVFNFIGRETATAAMNHIASGMDRLGSKTKQFAKFSGVALLGVGTAMTGLAVEGLKLGVKTAAGLEQAQVGFTTLLGSGQKAAAFLKNLTSFAAATPFELNGLIESSRTLIGVGLSAKDTMKALQSFGDAASAVGVGQDNFQRIMLATSQAISAGKFQAGDLNQIVENGIPVWTILSKSMHKTVPELRDLASRGKLLSKDVLPALESQMHKDYGGAMAKQSATLNGLWSTFTDTLSLGLAKAITPMIPALKVGLAGASTIASKALEKLPGILQGMTKDFKIAKTYITGTLVPALQGAFKNLKDALPDVNLSSMGKGFAGQAASWGTAIIGGIKTGLKTGDWSGLGSTIGDGLSKALIGGGHLFTVFEKWFASVDWLNVGKSVGKTVAPFVLGLSLTLIDGLIDAFKKHPGEVLFALATIIPVGKVLTAFKPLRAVLEALPFGKWIAKAFDHSAAPAFDGAWTFIKFAGRGIAKGFAEVFPQTSGFVGRLGRLIGTWLRLNASGLARAGRDMIEGVFIGIGRAGGRALRVIGQVIGWLTRPFRPAGTWLLSAGLNLIKVGLIGGMLLALGVVRSGVGIIINAVKSPFKGAYGWLLSAGGNVLQGFWNGAKSVWTKIQKWVGGIASWIKDHKGPVSLDRVLLFPAGAALMSGFLKGLQSGAGPAWDFVKHVGGKSIAMLRNSLSTVFSPGAGVAGSANARLGQIMARAYGWGSGSQWSALNSVVMRESGWRNTAQNPTSTAYGIFQFLNSTWASVGARKTSDPAAQIAAGLRYISSRYGSPLGALAHERQFGWYGTGGMVSRPTLVGVGEAGPERVLSARQTRSFEKLVKVMDRGGMGGGGLTVTINAVGSDIELENKIVRVVTNARRHGRLA